MKDPYWKRITLIEEAQRAKGMQEYGRGIEDNPADIMTRLQYLEEEMVDALVYIEWAKECLKEKVAKWIDISDMVDPECSHIKYGKGYLKCSKCGRIQFNLQDKKFCPNCGRAMVIK